MGNSYLFFRLLYVPNTILFSTLVPIKGGINPLYKFFKPYLYMPPEIDFFYFYCEYFIIILITKGRAKDE
jgi:hypothetical protein